MDKAAGFKTAFLLDGKVPEVGARLKQTAFAATLEQLTHAGLDDFYRGDIGREIAADLDRIGSPVTRADMENYCAIVDEPLSVPTQAGTLYNSPPPTQGLASLIVLALFERLRVTRAESFEHVHGIVEATKRAFRVRDGVVTDPEKITADLGQYFLPAFLDAEAAKIDPRKAARWPAPHGDGDTIWMGAADSSGLVVSYIQSLYWEFGSGCVLPATGIVMQNRGASFSLDPKALNVLAPGRRPFHTLNPAIALLRDKRIIAYGTMGGDGQPQSQAAMFTRHVAFGQPPDKALDAPRWLLGGPGVQPTPICGWSRVSTETCGSSLIGGSRRGRSRRGLFRTRWVTREQWYCTPTAPWKAVMTHARRRCGVALIPPFTLKLLVTTLHATFAPQSVVLCTHERATSHSLLHCSFWPPAVLSRRTLTSG